jgi:hypothetical protein
MNNIEDNYALCGICKKLKYKLEMSIPSYNPYTIKPILVCNECLETQFITLKKGQRTRPCQIAQ